MPLCKPLPTSFLAGILRARETTSARDFTNTPEHCRSRPWDTDGWITCIQMTKNRVLRGGCIAYSRANVTSVTIDCVARTRSIAGFARVQYRFEMRTAKSSNGMAHVPTSTTASCSNNPFVKTRLNWKEWLRAEPQL